MAIVGQFGRLSSTVTPVKGTPFNEFWNEDVAPNTWCSVMSIEVPAGSTAPSWFINCIHVTGRIHCIVKLKVAGREVYRGRMNLVTMNLTDRFDDGEIVVAPGQTAELQVLHEYSELLGFSGNLAGFIR